MQGVTLGAIQMSKAEVQRLALGATQMAQAEVQGPDLGATQLPSGFLGQDKIMPNKVKDIYP